MSSKRAVTTLLRVASRAQRSHSILPARRTLTINQTLSITQRPSQFNPNTIRPFSQSASSESKIYNFEDVRPPPLPLSHIAP